MEVLDSSIANVALPHIAGSLGASYEESTWVLTSYLVSSAIVLPISGWLSTRIGRKRFYMSCVVLFTASSILCGLAPSLPLLIFFRVLQGAGAVVFNLPSRPFWLIHFRCKSEEWRLRCMEWPLWLPPPSGRHLAVGSPTTTVGT